MSPQDVGQYVCKAFDEFLEQGASDDKRNALREHLLVWFRSVDESLAFEGMMWVIEHSDRFQHQQLAGELLARRGVPLLISPEDFVRRVAPRLSSSSSEVARYLDTQVGHVLAQRVVASLIRVATDKRLQVGLRSLAYWLGMTDVFEELADEKRA